jgi:hypothetical protein
MKDEDLTITESSARMATTILGRQLREDRIRKVPNTNTIAILVLWAEAHFASLDLSDPATPPEETE